MKKENTFPNMFIIIIIIIITNMHTFTLNIFNMICQIK